MVLVINHILIYGLVWCGFKPLHTPSFYHSKHDLLACLSWWTTPAHDSDSPWCTPPLSISSMCCSCVGCWLSTEASFGELQFMEFELASWLSVALNHVKKYFRNHYIENNTTNIIGIIILIKLYYFETLIVFNFHIAHLQY
jgi:hypothetical protein